MTPANIFDSLRELDTKTSVPRQSQYIALPGQLNCRSTMETQAPGEGDVLWLTGNFFAVAGAPGGKEIPL